VKKELSQAMEIEAVIPSRGKLEELFRPYCHHQMSGDDPYVRRELKNYEKRFRRDRLGSSLFRVFKGWRRRQEYVQDHYYRSWGEIDWSMLDPGNRQHLMRWGTQYYRGNSQVIGRLHLACLEGIIELYKPRRVLEVGCGRGINLILLAERFPHVEFYGLDLSVSGIRRAQELDAQLELPPELVRFAPFDLPTRRTPGKLTFVQGSAVNLSFSEGHFDFVYTKQALEQMEPYRDQVFSEIRRVCSGHAAFFEPFRDWNEQGASRNRIVAKDYFSARIADIGKYGFRPVCVLDDLPVKSYMAVGMVLAACIN
jgi:SAM-dependent methyltransferase